MPPPILKAKAGRGRSRPQDVDRHVGAQMRKRRIMLGLTQHQLADLIDVTYQQTHKYETGCNRIAASRLCGIARALGVGVGYFFEGTDRESTLEPTPQQRLLHELARNFVRIASRKQQEALCDVSRALANLTAERVGDGLEEIS